MSAATGGTEIDGDGPVVPVAAVPVCETAHTIPAFTEAVTLADLRPVLDDGPVAGGPVDRLVDAHHAYLTHGMIAPAWPVSV